VDIEGIIYNQILPALKETSLRNFYYDKFSRIRIGSDLTYRWIQKTASTNECTGYLTDANNDIVGYDVTTVLRNLEIGALLKFSAPTGQYFIKNKGNRLELTSENTPYATNYIWAKVVSISENGSVTELEDGTGPVKLSAEIPSFAVLTQIVPSWRTSLESNIITTMVNLIFSNKPFGLRYDITTKSWKIIFENDLNITSNFNVGKTGDTTNQKLDASWLLLFTTDTEFYTVKIRKLRYVFESDKKIRFYYDSTNRVFDTKSNTIIKDKIKILGINNKPNLTTSFTYDLEWEITNEFIGSDGYVDNKKIELSFNDRNDDGVVDDPDLFDQIVAVSSTSWSATETYVKDQFVSFNNNIYKSLVNNNINVEPTSVQAIGKWQIDYGNYIILEKYETLTGQFDYRYVENIKTDLNPVVIVMESASNFASGVNNQYYYFLDTDIVARWSSIEGRLIYNLDYKVFLGRSLLKFQYIHSADYETRIDPGQINIVDLYVLTKNYDLEFRRWLGGAIDNEPLPPSSDQLNITMSPSLNPIKAMSDELIYHSVKYKVLFGPKATPNLRAIFKLIKNPEQSISDNEIRSKVLAAINEFFTIENWDFGDSFYFSELVTYVMNRTAPYLVNILIVPRQTNLFFGSLFEIKSESDQVFINGATSDDVEVIDAITASQLSAQGAITSATNIVSQQNIISGLGSY